MPLLENLMKAIKATGKPISAPAPYAHDGDEIFLGDADSRRRDADLAILRSLCS